MSSGRLWRCPACSGQLVDHQALGRLAEPAERSALLVSLRSPSGLDCPICGAEMLEGKPAGVTVDGCAECEVVWFDADELAPFREGLDFHERRRGSRMPDDETHLMELFLRLVHPSL